MILVVGPGRCGTSTVARILHEDLGVHMGNSFREPDEQNPYGYYEDVAFRNLNAGFLEGTVPFPQFVDRLHTLITSRRGRPWGVKDPRLCYLAPYYLAACPERTTIIRCRRPAGEVARSMSRCYGWTDREALEETQRRDYLLDLLDWRPLLDVLFYEPRSDDSVRAELQEHLR